MNKFMLSAALTLCLLSITCPVLAATQQFTGAELGVEAISAPEITAGTIQDLFSTTDRFLAEVPAGLQSFAAPVKKFKGGLQDPILDLVNHRGAELVTSLKKYQTRAADHLTYAQIDLPRKPALQSLVNQTNTLLKKSYQEIRMVNLAGEMLELAEADLAQSMQTRDPVGSAAVGLVAISVSNMAMNAYKISPQLEQDSQSLLKRVESQLTQMQQKIQANPFDALSLGEDLALLVNMSSELSAAGLELSKAVEKIPSLMDKSVQLMGQVKIQRS